MVVQSDTETNKETNTEKMVRTFLAEGVETALSIKEAGFQGKIVATLGVHNFKHYLPLSGERLILCGDHDAQGSSSALVLEKTVKSFQDKGYNVWCVVPDQEGQDFNDILKNAGQAGVQEAFQGVSQGISCGIPQENISSDTSRDLLPQKNARYGS